jgi:hypothetical protein
MKFVTQLLKKFKPSTLSKETANLASITIHPIKVEVEEEFKTDDSNNSSQQECIMDSKTLDESPSKNIDLKEKMNLTLDLELDPSQGSWSPGVQASVLSFDTSDSFGCSSTESVSTEDPGTKEDEMEEDDAEGAVEAAVEVAVEVAVENQEITSDLIEYNQSLLDAQVECINTNNDSLEIQREQMQQMNDYLLQQQQAYMTNQAMANRLLEQMNEYQMKINYLQQQVYYHRTDLDRLAEQTLQLEDKIRTKEQTIREQEKQIESNNQVLQYDKNMMSSFGKVFESEPYYANQLMTAAMMAYP